MTVLMLFIMPLLSLVRALRCLCVSWVGFTVCAPIASSIAAGEALPEVIRLEAEDGHRAGNAIVASMEPGFSGAGYVEGFMENTDRLALSFKAREGIYDVTIHYRSAVKKFLYEVNGLVLTGRFLDSQGAFADQRMGKIELRDGDNTLTIYGGWKRYIIDRIDLTPVTALPPLAKPSAALCDPLATPAARDLMSYLVENYGTHMLSGAIEGPDIDYVKKHTGELPAIIAGDLLNITTTPIRYVGITPGETEGMIERAKQGHILTYCWHWRAPFGLVDKSSITTAEGKIENARWYRGFYTYATTLDIEAVLASPESKEYALLMTDIDMIAAELRKLDDWGIPVLWRPLHESEGRWFWWGAKGPKPFIQLWRILYDRLTRVHGLHNLIWVYTGTANLEWYPGDDVVDIIGIDDYPESVSDPLSPIWEDVQRNFGGRKLIALSEFGGVPDLAAASKLGVNWAYFASWNKELGPMKMTKPALKRIYRDPRMINLSDLPKNRWKPFDQKVDRDR